METPSPYEVDAWWNWVPVVIDKRPLQWWDTVGSERQAEYLSQIDPAYFIYISLTHEPQLDGEDAMQAALALRMAYSHAIESLFALIAAAVQAPHCPAGWLLQYRNSELRNVVRNLCERDEVLNCHRRTISNWDDVASTLSIPLEDKEVASELRAASKRLWQALAKEFIEESFESEYNSIKHGFRATAGGSFVRFGIKGEHGAPITPERMSLHRTSKFGSDYPIAVKIDRHQWRFDNQRNNWHPRVFAKRIPLIARSMLNIIAYLRLNQDGPTDSIRVSPFTRDDVTESLADPDKDSSSWQFNVRTMVDHSIFLPKTPEEILRVYLRESEERGSAQDESS